MIVGERKDLLEIAMRLRRLRFHNPDLEIEVHNLARRLEDIAHSVTDGRPIDPGVVEID